jgi:hypothetical protein
MRRPLVVLAVTALLVPAASVVFSGEIVEQPTPDAMGRSVVVVPDRTDQGSWDGTWVYANRDAKYALWLRTNAEGRPEARLKYQSISSPETFETGWDGKASYALAGMPVTFALTFERADAVVLVGSWNWDAEFGDSARTEVGTFEAFRSGDGRSMVLRFKSYARTVRRKDKVRTAEALPVWTFRKVSKREALWDELPF